MAIYFAIHLIPVSKAAMSPDWELNQANHDLIYDLMRTELIAASHLEFVESVGKSVHLTPTLKIGLSPDWELNQANHDLSYDLMRTELIAASHLEFADVGIMRADKNCLTMRVIGGPK